MTGQKRVTKAKVKSRRGDVESWGGKKSQETVKADLERELDEVLDEIDSVLEKNAEEFVQQYVQKGGE